MKKSGVLAVVVCVMAVANFASADTFGTGSNQFTIDFVPISGSTNPTSVIPVGTDFTFTGVTNDYRMGTYEITNDQWNKFKTVYGTVTGSPSSAYSADPYWTGESIPTNNVSWYEAAQFVNYLNTSTGHQAAYKFTGTQGTSNYTPATWVATDAGYNANNPYRNSNAFYFLPTENEWVKAAYWNGTSLQTYANASAGDLVSGLPDHAKWNYNSHGYGLKPWNVGSGSQELNGTYDMMGNIWEWAENPYSAGSSGRGLRGGGYQSYEGYIAISPGRIYGDPYHESSGIGFRVASVPEPATLLLLGLGAVFLRRKKH